MSDLAKKKCKPCEGGVPPLTPEAAATLHKELNPEWMLVDGGRMLARGFEFPNYKATIAFVNKVADLAEEEDHHPDLTVSWGNVGVELWTHKIGGLSENDFILAAKIDQIS